MDLCDDFVEICVQIKLALIRVAEVVGSKEVRTTAKSPCLNCRTWLKLPKIMSLCTYGCFACAAQLAYRSCPDSKCPVLHLLTGKLRVYRETAWRNNLIPCITLELASRDARNSPHLHRAKRKWKRCLTESNVIFLLLYIISIGSKQKELFFKMTEFPLLFSYFYSSYC